MVLDEIKKKERREGREEGLEEGIEIGKENTLNGIVLQLLQKMHDAKQVAELLGMPLKEVERIAEQGHIDL